MKPKKVAFICPNHGLLQGSVEYLFADTGSEWLVDFPVKHCPQCHKYYTPFSLYLSFYKIRHNGQEVAASKGVVQRSFPREDVRTPRLIGREEELQLQEQLRYVEQQKQEELLHIKLEEEKRKEERLLQKEKSKQYFDSLREVLHDCIILTNKPCFINEHRCPCCLEKTKKEHVRISQRWKHLFANIYHCDRCDSDYITPVQFDHLCDKAAEKIRGNYSYPFISPLGMEIEFIDDKYLFIPEWATDFGKYDHHHLPPKGDNFYDMTDEEYAWVREYFQPEEFNAPLRKKSFLGEEGYSTTESEIRRHIILQRCVEKYGKSRVINQLKSNMKLRLKQKDGEQKYEQALNVWRSDIWYVENKLSSE